MRVTFGQAEPVALKPPRACYRVDDPRFRVPQSLGGTGDEVCLPK